MNNKFINDYISHKDEYKKMKNILFGGKKQKYKHNKDNKDNKMSNNDGKYTENLSEPWFTLISLGLKTVEGRKNKGRFKEMQVGDIIEWSNNNFKPRSIKTKITRKTTYDTFKKYLETEGLDKCLPGIPTLEHGLSVYYKYFTKEEEQEFGVIAIEMELI